MITQSQMLPTGMVTSSPTNPLDQVPVGPQVFPFGTPQTAQSIAEPYQASNYLPGIKSSQLLTTGVDTTYQTVAQTPELVTEYQVTQPSVQYQTVEAVASEPTLTEYQVAEALPVTNVETIQQGVYDASALQAAQYQTGYQYRTVMKPVVRTGYQTVVNYKPVVKTGYVPRVTTKYVAVPTNAQVQGSLVNSALVVNPALVNPPLQAVTPVVQQSLLVPTTPLAATVQTPAMSLAPQALAMSTTPVSAGEHFVRNYPIY